MLTKISEEFEIIKTIYIGSRSKVFLVKVSERFFICKASAAADKIEWQTNLKREYELLSIIDSDYVVKAFRFYEPPNTAIILEWAPGYALSSKELMKNLSEDQVISFAIKVLTGLSHIHKQGIVHRDLAPHNIHYDPEHQTVKIFDFGLSKTLEELENMPFEKDLQGSLNYLAPEQTGRVNRREDFRTDIYALGCSLYHLITGEPPFYSQDPLKIIHGHLAIKPNSIQGISKSLNNLMLKMIEKEPEERFQNSLELLEAFSALQSEKLHPNLVSLLRVRKHSQLILPDIIFGRDAVLQEINHFLNLARQGKTHLTLVYGLAGMGKTALIRQALARQRCQLIEAKFEQVVNHIPYGSFLFGIANTIKKILARPTEELQKFKYQINQQVGANLVLAQKLIPELIDLCGSTQSDFEIEIHESKNRLQQTICDLLKSFYLPDKPLIIFLDDLQWADLDTIQLIQKLLDDDSESNFGLFCTYREEEIDSTHPLNVLLSAESAKISRIRLSPLSKSDLKDWFDVVFAGKFDGLDELVEISLKLAAGNPFDTIQLLKTLHQHNRIYDSNGRWQLNLDEIEEDKVFATMESVVWQNFKSIDAATLRAIQVVACAGIEVSSELVAFILKSSIQETLHDLEIAEKHGILVSVIDSDSKKLWKISHDKILAAVYNRMDEQKKNKVHYNIACFLIDAMSEAKNLEMLFQCLSHLLVDLTQIEPERTEEVLKLLRDGANAAKFSASYSKTLRFSTAALQIMGENAWQSQKYQLSLEIATLAAQSGFLCQDFNAMSEFSDLVLAKAKTDEDRIPILQLQLIYKKSLGLLAEAAESALEIFKKLDAGFPSRVTPIHIILDLVRTKVALRGFNSDNILNLPAMKDVNKLHIMMTTWHANAAFYFALPKFFPLTVFNMVRLSVRYGNCSISPLGYASYGLALCCVLGEIEKGFQFGKIAQKLIDKIDNKALMPVTYFLSYGFTNHFKEHLRESIEPLLNAHQAGITYGDLETSSHCAYTFSYCLLHLGERLEYCRNEFEKYQNRIQILNHKPSYELLKICRQTVGFLSEEDHFDGTFNGRHLQENDFVKENQDHTSRFNFYFNKMQVAYFLGYDQEAIEAAQDAKPHIESMMGTYTWALFPFYESLILFRMLEARQTWPKGWRKIILRNIKLLRKWAKFCPENFSNKVALLKAELCRVRDQNVRAKEWYEEAFFLSKKHGFNQEAAVAAECATLFFKNSNQHFCLEIMAQKAFEYYTLAGYQACSQRIIRNYASLVNFTSFFNTTNVTQESVIDASGVNDRLDTAAVFKTISCLFSEQQLPALLEKLLSELVEVSGAERCILLRYVNEKWRPYAYLDPMLDQQEEGKSLFGPWPLGYSQAVVNFVAQTGKNLVIDRGKDHELSSDDFYLKKVKSVFAVPLFYQRSMKWIVYCENNLAAKTFTFNRMNVVSVILSQAGILLENARVFSHLEELVKERTIELERANHNLQQLIQERRNLFRVVCHDIANPLTLLNYALSMLKKNFDEKYLRTLEKGLVSINKVLTESRKLEALDSQKSSIELTKLNLFNVLEASLDLFKPRMAEKNIQLVFENQTSLSELMVWSNEVVLGTNIINNILSNAIKFSFPNSQLLLRVEVEDETFILSFKDYGVGIPDSLVAILFDPSKNTSRSGTQDEKGTGFGMPLVKAFTEKLGGTIEVESCTKEVNSSNHGTTIRIRLPINIERSA